ncbi:MAG: hypothetical protein JSU72_13760 [Deltaproteobacteria bacterium]|nr:MAG: hypothetical protein JSU72_13760 [Deltaproteobacteria bacterium]
MNTPAHVAVNLVILGKKERPQTTAWIVVGAILPDLPMFLFYLYEKVWRKIPEHLIWSQAYDEPGWQVFFDLFNSLPLLILALLLALYRGARRFAALFASMVLHSLGDLLLHHDDAHRHLFPFSDWRFRSSVSYWDPRYFGEIVGPLEAVAVLGGCMILARRFTSVRARVLIGCLATSYAVYWGYALLVWA